MSIARNRRHPMLGAAFVGSMACSMAVIACKPSTSSEKVGKAGGRSAFNGSCSTITKTNIGTMNTIEECWEMYGAPSAAAAEATCTAANMNYGGGTTATGTFSASTCRRASPVMICKVPFVKGSYQILFQYTQTTSCNKGTQTTDPGSPSASSNTTPGASTPGGGTTPSGGTALASGYVFAAASLAISRESCREYFTKPADAKNMMHELKSQYTSEPLSKLFTASASRCKDSLPLTTLKNGYKCKSKYNIDPNTDAFTDVYVQDLFFDKRATTFWCAKTDEITTAAQTWP